MNKTGRLAVSLLPICFSAAIGALPPPDDAALLQGILDNAQGYCRKLNDYAYYFICREAVTEVIQGKTNIIWTPPSFVHEGQAARGTTMIVEDSRTRNTYLYEYQLIRKKGDNQEKRILLEKNGRRVNVPDVPLGDMRFYFQNFAFGPVDLFGDAGRLKHQYRIVGRDKFKGEKAVVVEAFPTEETSGYNPGGKVWVREGDNAILKIEWDHNAVAGFKDIEAAAAAVKAVPAFTLVTEYSVEKNGIRFPSRVLIREAYIRTKSKKLQTVSEVTIDYKDYKFFQVEVETK